MEELVEVRSLAPFSSRRSCEHVHSMRLVFSEGRAGKAVLGCCHLGFFEKQEEVKKQLDVYTRQISSCESGV